MSFAACTADMAVSFSTICKGEILPNLSIKSFNLLSGYVDVFPAGQQQLEDCIAKSSNKIYWQPHFKYLELKLIHKWLWVRPHFEMRIK